MRRLATRSTLVVVALALWPAATASAAPGGGHRAELRHGGSHSVGIGAARQLKRAGGHAQARLSMQATMVEQAPDGESTAPQPGGARTSQAQSGTILEAGFENGLENWNIAGVGEVVPTVVSGNARSGEKAGRVVLTGTQNRSELSLGGTGTSSDADMVHFEEGDEYWYGFSFNIQSMVWGHPGAHNVIMQFKSDGEGSPNLALQLWDYAGDDGVSGGRGLWVSSERGDHFAAPVGEGAWHDVAVHFRASSQGEGSFEVYLDGELVASEEGVSTIVPGHSWAYIKNGLYRNGAAIPGTSEVLFDAAKLGTSFESVQPTS